MRSDPDALMVAVKVMSTAVWLALPLLLLELLPPPVTAPIALQFACIFNMLPACQADISALSSFLWRMLVQIG